MPTETSGIVQNVSKIEDVALSVRIAYSGSNPIYIGVAAPGSSISDNVWRIKRISYSGDNPTVIEWADGDTKYDNVWGNRTLLSYS